MRNKFFLLVLLLCVLGDVSHAADGVQQQYVSADLVKAIQELKADAFFSPDVRESEAFKNFGIMKGGGRLDPEKSYQSNLFNAKYLIDAQHYQEIADKFCEPLADAYSEALDDVEGDVDPYIFTDKITNAFESVGAYALPIQIVSRNFDAKYILEKNLDPLRDANKKIEISQFLDNHFDGLGFGSRYLSKDGGIEIKDEYDRKDSQGWPRKLSINTLSHALTNKWQYKEKDFNLNYSLIQPYVFIFHQDPKDMNKEHIFLYVDVPYDIDVTNFRKKVELKKSTDGLKCYANSSAAAKVNGSTFRVFKSGEKSISLLENFRPLMAIPDSNYLKYGDTVQIKDISNPSLECLLIFEGAQDGNLENCKTEKYRQAYIKLMNERICVAKEKNIKPLNVNEKNQFLSGFNLIPSYLRGYFGFYTKDCLPVAKRKNKND